MKLKNISKAYNQFIKDQTSDIANKGVNAILKTIETRNLNKKLNLTKL